MTGVEEVLVVEQDLAVQIDNDHAVEAGFLGGFEHRQNTRPRRPELGHGRHARNL
jgi:hypothetical protein